MPDPTNEKRYSDPLNVEQISMVLKEKIDEGYVLVGYLKPRKNPFSGEPLVNPYAHAVLGSLAASIIKNEWFAIVTRYDKTGGAVVWVLVREPLENFYTSVQVEWEELKAWKSSEYLFSSFKNAYSIDTDTLSFFIKNEMEYTSMDNQSPQLKQAKYYRKNLFPCKIKETIDPIHIEMGREYKLIGVIQINEHILNDLSNFYAERFMYMVDRYWGCKSCLLKAGGTYRVPPHPPLNNVYRMWVSYILIYTENQKIMQENIAQFSQRQMDSLKGDGSNLKSFAYYDLFFRNRLVSLNLVTAEMVPQLNIKLILNEIKIIEGGKLPDIDNLGLWSYSYEKNEELKFPSFDPEFEEYYLYQPRKNPLSFIR